MSDIGVKNGHNSSLRIFNPNPTRGRGYAFCRRDGRRIIRGDVAVWVESPKGKRSNWYEWECYVDAKGRTLFTKSQFLKVLNGEIAEICLI